MNYNKVFLKYKEFWEKNDTIPLPLMLGETDSSLMPFFHYFNKIKGSRRYHNRVDYFSVSPEDINDAKLSGNSVRALAYNSEANEFDELNPIEIGYYTIVESMADMIQRIYDPEVEHEVVPYQTVQIICQKEYPEIKDDYRKMVAICICALMFSNPGVGLFEAIKYAKQWPNLNGDLLYRQFVRDNKLHLHDGNEITITEMYTKLLSEFKQTLDIVFGGQLGYFGKVIDNALIGAESGRNELLSLLYDDSIPKNEYICRLADFYGYPYIESYDLALWPGEEKRAIDVAVAVGFEILYKRCTNKDKTDCPCGEMCRRYGRYEYECRYDQWAHNGMCPFTAAMHFFNLDGKKFVLNNDFE